MCREIVVVDRTMARANGVATDMRYATPLSPTVDVRAGDYDVLTDAALVTSTEVRSLQGAASRLGHVHAYQTISSRRALSAMLKNQ